MDVIVDGLKVHVATAGQKKSPIVLMLHGWGASSQSFIGVSKQLSDKYYIVAPDLPGFGGSEMPKEAWGVKNYANFVVSLLRKLKLKKIHCIVGHSMGGRVAMHITGQNLLNPGNLVLIGSHGIVESRSIRSRAYKVVAKVGKHATKVLPNRVRSGLRSKLYQTAGAQDYLKAGPMKETFLELINTDSQPDAALISVPTLLIYGRNDTQTPPGYGKIFHELIARSTLIVVAGEDHFIHENNPKLVADKIKGFLC